MKYLIALLFSCLGIEAQTNTPFINGGQSIFLNSGGTTVFIQSNAPPPSAGFVRVQSAHTYPGTTASLTGTHAGNTIVVFFSDNTGSTSYTCSDGVNTYTLYEGTDNGSCSAFAAVALNIAGGNITVTASDGGNSDAGLTIVEYSGITSVDVHGHITTPVDTTVSIPLTTTGTDMFSLGWGNEITDGTTSVLNAGSIAGFTIQHDTGHYDQQTDWLNSGAGFPSGSWSLDSTAKGATLIIGLSFK